MGMVKCENCNNDISDMASTCPHCGKERTSSERRVSKKMIAICSSIITAVVTVTTLMLDFNSIINAYIKPDEVIFDSSILQLYEGEREGIYFSVNPEDAAIKKIKFLSDTPDVVEVENGNILVAKQVGTAYIYQEGNEDNFMSVYVGRPDIGWPTKIDGASVTAIWQDDEDYYFWVSFYNQMGGFWVVRDDILNEITVENNYGEIVYSQIFDTAHRDICDKNPEIEIRIKKTDIPLKLPSEGKLSIRTYNGYMDEIQHTFSKAEYEY